MSISEIIEEWAEEASACLDCPLNDNFYWTQGQKTDKFYTSSKVNKYGACSVFMSSFD